MSEKKYEVSKETLKLTNKCPDNFKCLSGTLTPLCVAKISSNGAPYIQCVDDEESCVYCESFDDIVRMCTCPTRLELYVRHGI